MSSFKDGLRRSGQSVLDARAQNLYEMTKIEEERFIQECKMKVLRIKNELNKHRDLSVKSTTSLEVGNGFDPKAWVAKRHQLERDLRVANIEYALDVTGSMRRTPHEMIKDNFPKLMDALMQLGVKDPQLLFMAVGDHEYDRYPIQVGQFESDTEKIVNSLEEFVLEGGGGGNAGESYLLAHIIAGYHTETDSWFKRHKKGYLFTIGDEPNLHGISGRALEDFLGYQHPANPISEEEAVKKAQEQYNVYHIHVTNGSYGTRIAPGWKNLLGQNVLTCDSHNVHNVIAEAIKQHEDLTGIPYEAQAVALTTSVGEESGTYTY